MSANLKNSQFEAWKFKKIHWKSIQENLKIHRFFLRMSLQMFFKHQEKSVKILLKTYGLKPGNLKKLHNFFFFWSIFFYIHDFCSERKDIFLRIHDILNER